MLVLAKILKRSKKMLREGHKRNTEEHVVVEYTRNLVGTRLEKTLVFQDILGLGIAI